MHYKFTTTPVRRSAAPQTPTPTPSGRELHLTQLIEAFAEILMETFNSNIRRSNKSTSTSPIIDSLMMRSSRYPSSSSYNINSPPFSDPFIINNSENIIYKPSLLRYSRSTKPSIDVFGSPTKQYLHHQNQLLKASCRSSLTSPLASIENLLTPPSRSPPHPVFAKTSVKAEEDVLVMDGILVKSPSSSGNGSGIRAKSPLNFGSLPGSPNSYLFRTEICPSWEEAGICLYGSKCQFAHSKEDLRPSRFSPKNKPEGLTYKANTIGGTCSYGTKGRFVQHAAAVNEGSLPQKVEQRHGTIDWSPIDDGIAVRLPSYPTVESPTREALDAYINSVLYGSRQKHRLPVFKEFCPD
ncbi:Zinc finger protein like [Thalictrum thalictroides]|uniref:Zinc finger protein like n=1 Tax=Thalictrum thalictroides TaxID=46969 RepID=A0A7J6VSM1_THATH|nr:Zinc finger protein like [Thalictrum thalictroides]